MAVNGWMIIAECEEKGQAPDEGGRIQTSSWDGRCPPYSSAVWVESLSQSRSDAKLAPAVSRWHKNCPVATTADLSWSSDNSRYLSFLWFCASTYVLEPDAARAGDDVIITYFNRFSSSFSFWKIFFLEGVISFFIFCTLKVLFK